MNDQKQQAKRHDTLTPTQAARIIDCHVSTIYRLILVGSIPARRVCGHRYGTFREWPGPGAFIECFGYQTKRHNDGNQP